MVVARVNAKKPDPYNIFLAPLSLLPWYCCCFKKKKRKTKTAGERLSTMHVFTEKHGTTKLWQHDMLSTYAHGTRQNAGRVRVSRPSRRAWPSPPANFTHIATTRGTWWCVPNGCGWLVIRLWKASNGDDENIIFYSVFFFEREKESEWEKQLPRNKHSVGEPYNNTIHAAICRINEHNKNIIRT